MISTKTGRRTSVCSSGRSKATVALLNTSTNNVARPSPSHVDQRIADGQQRAYAEELDQPGIVCPEAVAKYLFILVQF